MVTNAKDSIYRGTNLNPDHARKWDQLAEHASMNRNQFIRFLFTNLTEADVDTLIARL